MYDLLRQFGDSAEVKEILDRVIGSDKLGRSVRGIHVGLDRYWDRWSARYRVRRMISREAPFSYPFVFDPLDDWFDPTTFGGKGPFDLDDLLKGTPPPPRWDEHCRARGYQKGSSPLYVRVLMRSPEVLRDLKESQELTDFRTPVEFVFMPPFAAMGSGVVSVSLGASVGQSMPARAGTLGGVLMNKSDSVAYGVTCAHVVGATNAAVYQPAPQDSASPSQIGTVFFETLPRALQAGENCTSRARGGSSERSVDFALIELLPSVAYESNAADTIAQVTTTAQGASVIFTGRSTEKGAAETGPLCLWDEIDVKGTVHCFGDIFVLEKPRPWYVNTDLVKEGDSGAWVIRHSATGASAWWGMIIAGNGSRAYASFAENMLEASLRSTCGQLVLPP